MFKKKEKKGLEKFIKVWKPLDYLVNVILNPTMWLSNYSSNKGVDNLLHDLVIVYEKDECKINLSCSIIQFYNSDFTVYVWIKNYPYAYGSSDTLYNGPLPTRYCRLLFNRWVESVYSKHMMGEK